VIKLVPGDRVYLYTDGYVDQIGGPEEKKFVVKRFKKTILKIRKLSMLEQKKELERIFEQWRGKFSQIDDILILGIKV